MFLGDLNPIENLSSKTLLKIISDWIFASYNFESIWVKDVKSSTFCYYFKILMFTKIFEK